MRRVNPRTNLTWPQTLGVVAACVTGLYFLGHFDPVPDRAPQQGSVFLYYGPEGETVAASDIAPDQREAAEAALQEADYFGAYAAGPGSRSGVWVGARSVDLARAYALARCGAGCTLVAERLPRHRDPSRPEPVLTHAMAVNIGVKWPFNRDVLAIGGANAWGFASSATGADSGRRAKRQAAEDCDLRRAAEAVPDDLTSAPCQIMTLNEIEDLRPGSPLYPAAYTIGLTALAPAAATQMQALPDPPPVGFFGPYLPPRLYGARAAATVTTDDVVRQAGWPEAGKAIALLKCEAGRRPQDPPCRVTHIRMPKDTPPDGVLQVTPDLFTSYEAWEKMPGFGAFAISPYGVWGFSYGWETQDKAIQKAADWCWYYTQKTWEYRQVEKAFLDAGLACRIVALREG